MDGEVLLELAQNEISSCRVTTRLARLPVKVNRVTRMIHFMWQSVVYSGRPRALTRSLTLMCSLLFTRKKMIKFTLSQMISITLWSVCRTSFYEMFAQVPSLRRTVYSRKQTFNKSKEIFKKSTRFILIIRGLIMKIRLTR
jgi:hypothetical protein